MKRQAPKNDTRYRLSKVPKEDILTLLGDVSLQLEDRQSLDTLARKSGWSKFHFHRSFTEIVGETPRQYAQRLRLDRAAGLLATSPDSVITIALSVGFSSHEVFSRAFRRQFDCSPTDYRTKLMDRSGLNREGPHVDLVNSVGPCLRMYHLLDNETRGVGEMPKVEIERREINVQPILFIQRRVARTQLQPLFAECFPELFQHCMKEGIEIAGQPIARYISTGAGLWTVDCAIPLARSASGTGEMEAGFLQAGPVAFAVHRGEYEKLPETNAAVESWIEKSGYQAAGAPWESYVTSPAEHPDVVDWRTEVFWPLAE